MLAALEYVPFPSEGNMPSAELITEARYSVGTVSLLQSKGINYIS